MTSARRRETRISRVIVILNSAAGSADGKADDVRGLFRDAGVDVRVMHPDENKDVAAIAREAAESVEEVIVAGGGDGTISAVAAALVGTGKILGVLPLGTLNHFAKDLGISLEPARAVQTIVRGRVAEVDVGEVNGRVFINNSSLGIYPRIVASREAQQERLGRAKWPAFLWAAVQAMHRFPFLKLRIKTGGKELSLQTAFLFIGNNEYEISGFNLGDRKRLDGEKLGLYLTQRTGRFGLFRLAFHALLGRVNQANDFTAYAVEEATIELHKPRLLVATDGEVTSMQTPLHYRIRPRALRVMVPPSDTTS